jgi:hypothetical protein
MSLLEDLEKAVPRVGPRRVGDGQRPLPRLGKTGEGIVSYGHGRYYEAASRRQMFYSYYPSTALVLASETFTAGTVRVSMVNGTAFADALPASVLALSLDGTLPIMFYDSSYRFAGGVLKSVGVAETYTDLIGGTNPALLNGDFESAEPPGVVWTRYTGVTITGGVMVSDGSGAAYGTLLSKAIGVIPLALYNYSWSLVTRTAGGARIGLGGNDFGPVKTTTDTYTGYIVPFTSPNTTAYFGTGSANFTGTVDNVTIRKVLTPSSSGAVIQASKTDSTENFGYKDPLFNPNAIVAVRVFKG